LLPVLHQHTRKVMMCLEISEGETCLEEGILVHLDGGPH
jgi:hypothetical protein